MMMMMMMMMMTSPPPSGNYESFAILGSPDDPQTIPKSTREREAYFLDFAKDLRAVVKKTPLMVTGR